MSLNLWNCLPLAVVVSVLLACQRFDNHVRSYAIDCGGESAFDRAHQKIYKVFLDGNPVQPENLARLTLNGQVAQARLSSKGCFALDASDHTLVAVTHRDGRHALVRDTATDGIGTYTPLTLESMKPINLDSKDKDQIFRDFCSANHDAIYLSQPRLSFFLNFNPLGHATLLTATGRIVSDGQSQTHSLLAATQLVTPELQEFSITLPGSSRVEIDIVDVFGNTITSPSCQVFVDPEAPKLVSIGRRPYFPSMFIQSDPAESVEFSFESPIPIRNVEIRYRDAKQGDQERQETYVPFHDKDRIWKVLAPTPNLSGIKNLTLAVESMSGIKVQAHAVLNFGERKYVEGGIKIARTSLNEKYLLMASYTGLVKVLDLASDLIIFEKTFDDDIKYADITDDGRTIILGLSAADMILDRVTGSDLRLDQPFSKFGFRLNGPQTRILGATENALIWIDKDSGAVMRTRKFERSTIRAMKISSDATQALISADNRKIYAVNLESDSGDTEFVLPCGSGLITLMEISPSKAFALFGCGTKVYRQDLLEPTAPAELIFEFNTDAWTLAISPDNSWMAAGSMSGEWYVANRQSRQQYPENELDSLRKGFKFETTVNTLAFSADSRFLIAGTENGSAKVFSIEDGDFVESVKARGQVLTAGFIHAQQKFYVGSIDGILRSQTIHAPLFAFDVGQRVEALAVSKTILAAGISPKANDLAETAAGTLLFDLMSRDFIGKVPNAKKVNTISFNPEGTTLLTASEDGTAKMISLNDLAHPLSIGEAHRKPGRPVRYASLSADGRELVILSSKIASTYHLGAYEKPALTLEAGDWMSYAHFSTDNRYIATAAADRVARIHDAKDGRVLASYTAKNWIWDADLTPDLSRFVNLNWDNELIIQRTERDALGLIVGLKEPSKVALPNGGEFMALSPDSQWAAVSLWNGQAFMVNLLDGFSYEMKCLSATQALRPVFSADSRWVALGQGNAGMVYQVRDGRPIQRAYHADRVTSVAFSQDKLISGSWDGRIRVTAIDEKAVVDCTSL